MHTAPPSLTIRRIAIACVAFLVAGCEAVDPARPVSVTVTADAVLSDTPLTDETVLFVGNLFGGAPNGVYRFDANGRPMDAGRFFQSGCCFTFGPDEYLYAGFQQGIWRFHPVTGERVGVFVPAKSGTLDLPLAPLFGPDGDFYLGDRGRQAIIRYDGQSGAFIGDFVKPGAGGMQPGGDPQFFAFGPDGNLYVASTVTHRVLRFDGETGDFIGEFVSAGKEDGNLQAPSGLTFGPDGNLYVGSTTTDRVLRYDGVTGEFLGEFVSEGSGGLDVPVGITFGPDGNLYVASAGTGERASVLRYDGTTGAFLGAFVPPGSGITGPRSLQFKSKITMCHRPPGRPQDARTISIGYTSASDHHAHGDAVGAC